MGCLVHRYAPAHLKRYRQIAEVLVRHGLGSLVGVLGLGRFVPFTRGLPGPLHRSSRARGLLPVGKGAGETGAPSANQAARRKGSTPEHLRKALEELGATFIKLGQILSTRADLLPPAYLAELAKLQDQVTPLPGEVIEKVVETELGRPLHEVFASFDRVPLAAASIGQAHAATLHSGVEVVVKVRRPGVVESIEEDLKIIQSLAAAASRRWALAEQYDLPSLAQEFAETLRSELDYIREGHNAERFAANFVGDPSIHIPKVFWETTTDQVLTLERIQGIKISDLDALDAAGIDRAALAERAASVLIKMVFEHGFYHADPHAGNFFIEPGGRIGLIDYGMIGTVTQETKQQLVDLLLAITNRQSDRLVDTLRLLGVSRRRVDRVQLRRDMERVLGKYYDRPLGEIAIGAFLSDFFVIIRRHHLYLPPGLALLCKTLMMDEGLGTQLDPAFNLARLLAPFAQRLLMQQYNPFFWLPRLSRVGKDAAQLGIELPQQLRHILGDLERGDLEIGMHPAAFDPLMNRLERLVNRMVLGMIASAFIVGLAVLTLAYFVHPFSGLTWIGALFITGFVIVSLLGVALAWGILRTKRRV